MDFREWIGRTETVSDVVTPTPYAALSATLDRPAERPAPGTPLPALWHWLFFLPLHRQSEIGPDGHAKRGGFLPPFPCPGGCGRAASSSFTSRSGWETR
jgi:3-methylfumaryl-CoA hydratase